MEGERKKELKDLVLSACLQEDYDDDAFDKSFMIHIVSKSKVGDRRRGRPEGSLFNSYYTEV